MRSGEDEQACTDGSVDYGGRCVPPVTAQYLGCIDGRGFSVSDEFGAGVTVPAVANSTFRGAYKRSKDEDSTVALQIVHDCLLLARESATSAGDRQAAGDYARRATRSIEVVSRALPAIELDPSRTLDCGSVEVGVPATCELTIESTGVKALKIVSIEVRGPDRKDFRVRGECVGTLIDPDQECVTTVEFTPSAGGRRDASLVVHQNLPRPDTGTSLPVSGTGEGDSPGHELAVSVNGNLAAGAVTSDPPGIACPGACLATFDDGIEVTLKVAGGQPVWDGCDSAEGDGCVVRVTADRTVVVH